MGTEVLRPQEFLIPFEGRMGISPSQAVFNHHHRRKNPNRPNKAQKPSTRTDPRTRPGPTISRRSSSLDDLRKTQKGKNQALGGGHVIILRRGESLDQIKPVNVSPARNSGDRSDVYAGSAVAMSPSPRSLPLPSFFSKKVASRVSDDSATRDLRRLLRLE